MGMSVMAGALDWLAEESPFPIRRCAKIASAAGGRRTDSVGGEAGEEKGFAQSAEVRRGSQRCQRRRLSSFFDRKRGAGLKSGFAASAKVFADLCVLCANPFSSAPISPSS
jgi:hypothetical protein